MIVDFTCYIKMDIPIIHLMLKNGAARNISASFSSVLIGFTYSLARAWLELYIENEGERCL